MSSMPLARWKYTGSTPGADSNTYNLFSTVTAFNGARSGFPLYGIETFVLDIDCDNDGTLKIYKSQDGGTNWYQIEEEAITGPAASAGIHRAYDVAAYSDWKIDWVNGGSAQTQFIVDMAGSPDA